ncbi:hypothetical protein [Actinoallomurus sp. NPDC050550]|uniref:hypothetical protein n=1 Tax=Actinoallomurus sp. NPDC050550 TaxID=3154937 RepID=UPI0033C2D852
MSTVLEQPIGVETAERTDIERHPGKDGYGHEVDVKLGEPLDLPAPWELTLDTAPLTV